MCKNASKNMDDIIIWTPFVLRRCFTGRIGIREDGGGEVEGDIGEFNYEESVGKLTHGMWWLSDW